MIFYLHAKYKLNILLFQRIIPNVQFPIPTNVHQQRSQIHEHNLDKVYKNR